MNGPRNDFAGCDFATREVELSEVGAAPGPAETASTSRTSRVNSPHPAKWSATPIPAGQPHFAHFAHFAPPYRGDSDSEEITTPPPGRRGHGSNQTTTTEETN